MRPRVEAGARHVGVHIGRARGDAEAAEIVAEERADAGAALRRRHVPLHEMIGEVGERIAQGGKLPVEDGADRRLGRRKNDVVEAVIAVDDAHRRSRRQMRRQPADQPFHLRDRIGLGGAILLRPAFDLARDVVVAAAEVAESERGRIERMQPRERGVHGVVDRRALSGLRVRHVRLPDDAALDVVHEIERRAGDAGIVAIKHRRGHGKASRIERAGHAELAVDRVRGRKQLARRLAPQHVAARRRLQKISGVGLAAFELPHAQRPCEIG